MRIQYKKLHDDAISPVKAHADDVGIDVFLHHVTLKDGTPYHAEQEWGSSGIRLMEKSPRQWTLFPGTPILCHTGVAVNIVGDSTGGTPFLKVEGRSSLAAKGAIPTGGIIDPGYTGEIIVILVCLDQHGIRLTQGDKIAQLVPYHTAAVAPSDIIQVSDFEATDRSGNGFGSTGK